MSQDKPVWITEAGWPVSGPTENQAVASPENSKAYWDELGCELFNNYNVWWYILRDNNGSPAPSPSFGIVGLDLEEPLFDLTCPTGSSGASTSAVTASANGAVIANGTVSSNVSTENANVTSPRTNLSSANQRANITEAANTTQSAPPSTEPSHSTSSIFSSDNAPQILKSLPAIVASNPSVIKKLPSILAANPDLMEQVDGMNFTEMAAEYDVAPVYVTMLQDAIAKAKKDHPKDVVHGAKAIVEILRDGDKSGDDDDCE